MEILSTGEKIKRTRIYKGITLKELCTDRISISKMSCIENGKVKADKDILEYIADKLAVDYSYLAKDVYEQIIENIDIIDKGNYNSTFENDVKLNLEYALDYGYGDLAFKLMHKLFNGYKIKGKLEDISDLIPEYYNLYVEDNTIEKTMTYFKDIAEYLYDNLEYREAGTYYGRLCELLERENLISDEEYVYVNYKEGMCYLKSNNHEKAYKHLSIAKENIDKVTTDKLKGCIYHYNDVLDILMGKDNKELQDAALSFYGVDSIEAIDARLDFATSYFTIRKEKEAIDLIDLSINLLEDKNSLEAGKLMIKCIKILISNGKYDIAEKISDRAINLVISLNDIKLIERGYYLKGTLLQKRGEYKESELYMNLSLDSLIKCGNKKELYKRYLDMANMYHKLNDIKDSLRYFTLAMQTRN